MRIFLDACAIIYQFEGSDAFRSATSRLLEALSKDQTEIEIAITRITMLECRVKPIKEKNEVLLAAYDDFFSKVQLVELSASVFERATQLRALYQLKTPDALQAAAALEWGDNVNFVTGDDVFSRIDSLNVQLIVAN